MKKYLNILLVLSVAGLIFSGYLSGVKLITNTCALGETCPIVWGYHACWYGFAMYLVMFILVVLARELQNIQRKLLNAIGMVSLIGIFFAGSLVVGEINTWIANSAITSYKLGLYTCAYGLIFYFLVFVTTAKALLKK